MNCNIHTINAENKILGRLASQAALLLRGKNKPTFQPHLDEGDEVIIKNVDKMKFTGKKLEQKIYKRHTGRPGHLKETKLKELYAKKPQEVFKRAVYNMLPKNKLRAGMMKRLKFEK